MKSLKRSFVCLFFPFTSAKWKVAFVYLRLSPKMSKHTDETGEMFIGKVVYKCANGSTEINAWFYFGKIKTKSSLNWKHQNQIKYSLSLTESKAKHHQFENFSFSFPCSRNETKNKFIDIIRKHISIFTQTSTQQEEANWNENGKKVNLYSLNFGTFARKTFSIALT